MDNILITGGTGFLGSWIVRVFCERGYSPNVLVRPESNIWRLSNLIGCNIIREDESTWKDVISALSPSIIIALDWSGVQNSDRNLDSQHQNTRRILEIANHATNVGIKHYIGFGSQAELGPTDNQITEFTKTNPTSAYGKAKCVTRESLEEMFSKANINFTWGRIFSTYGQLDSPTWLIPQMILTMSENKTFDMTLGEQNWNYLHAYDFASSVLSIVLSGEGHGVINIASPRGIQIAEVGNLIQEKMKKSGLLKLGAIPYRDDQVMNLNPDVSKIQSLGWKQEIELKSGLHQMVDWYCNDSNQLRFDTGRFLTLPKFRELKETFQTNL